MVTLFAQITHFYFEKCSNILSSRFWIVNPKANCSSLKGGFIFIGEYENKPYKMFASKIFEILVGVKKIAVATIKNVDHL